MKLEDALRMFLRRWYIVVPGILLAIAGALAAWTFNEPEYERQGVQIVLPGIDSLPEGATNPYLYLGGLALPTDIVVQAVSGQDVLEEVLADFPGASVEVERESASSPIITITVTAASDAAAEQLLTAMLERTDASLAAMQSSEGIAQGDRLSIVTLAVDTESTPIQRTRVLLVAAIGISAVVLTLVLAALVDGLSARRRRRGKGRRRARAEAAAARAEAATSRAEAGAMAEVEPETETAQAEATTTTQDLVDSAEAFTVRET